MLCLCSIFIFDKVIALSGRLHLTANQVWDGGLERGVIRSCARARPRSCFRPSAAIVSGISKLIKRFVFTVTLLGKTSTRKRNILAFVVGETRKHIVLQKKVFLLNGAKYNFLAIFTSKAIRRRCRSFNVLNASCDAAVFKVGELRQRALRRGKGGAYICIN